ncbi:hypothetical protein [Brachybacterium fresconis]|uniref:F0F1-type ATP synthase assembly protein I n=1 Tax=Brachybacterium fresconis TaxID=173363 RepID=A0ABS4YF00_9MICO|nr:hypothetical protein [Brachybacterium fresconis]MBP2407366.1 F0F1-type ATP synthase assembly protein I [Brachybacterium fresconis]
MTEKKESSGSSMLGPGLALGTGLGVLLGVLLDNVALGIALGPSIGLILGIGADQLRKRPGEDPADEDRNG